MYYITSIVFINFPYTGFGLLAIHTIGKFVSTLYNASVRSRANTGFTTRCGHAQAWTRAPGVHTKHQAPA